MRPSARTTLITGLLALVLLSACSGGRERVHVLAAASLTDVMPRLVEDYRERHGAIDIVVAYGGSQALATQVEEGAPADVFVSANELQAERLVDGGFVVDRVDLARNALVLAVEHDGGIATLEDAARSGVRVAIGAPDVPVGVLTERALAQLPATLAAAIRANVVTEDPNVRTVLSRIELGEADAAFVYATDVTSTTGVRAVALGVEAETTYVALLIDDNGGASEDARRFLEYLASAAAGALLRDAGFTPIAQPSAAAP